MCYNNQLFWNGTLVETWNRVMIVPNKLSSAKAYAELDNKEYFGKSWRFFLSDGVGKGR